jgi:hypothetical protein
MTCINMRSYTKCMLKPVDFNLTDNVLRPLKECIHLRLDHHFNSSSKSEIGSIPACQEVGQFKYAEDKPNMPFDKTDYT